MTAASPRLVNTIPDWSQCAVYEFTVLDPNTGYTTERCGYVGETARMPLDRLIEHLRSKDWGDTIVGWRVIGTYPDKASVLKAEAEAIRRLRPLYNVEANLDNRDRIPPWVQAQQRAERDAARAAVSGRVPAPRARPQRQPAEAARHVRPSRLSAKWQRRRDTALMAAALWVAATALVWWLLVKHFDLGWQVDARTAAVAALLPHCGWLAWKGRNRRWRHTGRWAALAVAVAALALSGAFNAGSTP